MIDTEAWVLPAAELGSHDRTGTLHRTTIRIPEPAGDEAVVEPLVGSWEGNMSHAVARTPVDICRQRGEPYVVLGNSGVVRVHRPAAEVPGPSRGELCLCLSLGARASDHRDRFGYSRRIFGYDAPGTYGLLAKLTKIPADLLLPLPAGTAFPIERWAPCLRYFTAWDNWKVALDCWRTQMGAADPAEHLVFGWGGGVTLAQLILARRAGFRTAMMAGSTDRLDTIARHGITPLDRRDYPGLGHSDASAATRWACERRFLRCINELSDGLGVAVFLDHIGGALYPTTLRALARQAVIASCGWKAGTELSHIRPTECIRRHIHLHTHGWRHDDSATIRDFQEATGWLADTGTAYAYRDIPELVEGYHAGRLATYYPLYRIVE